MSVHTDNFIQLFQPNVAMRYVPIAWLGTFSASSSRKSLISKAFAADDIFGRDRRSGPDETAYVVRLAARRLPKSPEPLASAHFEITLTTFWDFWEEIDSLAPLDRESGILCNPALEFRLGSLHRQTSRTP